MYITTRTDTDATSTPTVTVLEVHEDRGAAKLRGGTSCNVLEVWDGPLGGQRRRAPRPGDRCGTFRDGRTLYVVGPID
jgi:hypothetical protein